MYWLCLSRCAQGSESHDSSGNMWYEMHKNLQLTTSRWIYRYTTRFITNPFCRILSTDTWNNYFSKMFVSAAKVSKREIQMYWCTALACGPCGYAKDLMNLAKITISTIFSHCTVITMILLIQYDCSMALYTNHKLRIFTSIFNWYVP